MLELSSKTVDMLCQACDDLEDSGHDPVDIQFALALCLSATYCRSEQEIGEGIGFKKASEALEKIYQELSTLQESKGNA